CRAARRIRRAAPTRRHSRPSSHGAGGLDAHQLGVIGPEAAQWDIGYPVVTVGNHPSAAEFDNSGAIGIGFRGTVRNLDGLTVLHRDQTGRTDEVSLPQTMQRHLGRVILVAEHRLEYFDFVDAARPDLANRQAVADLY